MAKIIPSGGAAVPAWRRQLEAATAARLKTREHGSTYGVRPNSVMLVVDCSGSMGFAEQKPDRRSGERITAGIRALPGKGK